MLSDGKSPVFWTPIDSVRAHPFDMKHAAFVFGSAEDQLGTILQAQINAVYGVPLVAKSLLTTAHGLDEQAAAEKASHTLLAALVGARMFTNAGFLAVDNYVSPIQMVIDREIVEYVRHVVEGLPVDDEAMGLAVIEEVMRADGDFLSHPSTYANFRRSAWYPDLFEHRDYLGTDSNGGRMLTDRAREIARDLIGQGDYVLPESSRSILDNIYRRVQRSIENAV
jgi:trimethylamine--corrinoid protein Co-methyltransferase